MYLMNLHTAKQLSLHTRGFDVEVEVLAQMSLQGRVTEVPISYRKRIGAPKLTWVHGFDILKTILGLARSIIRSSSSHFRGLRSHTRACDTRVGCWDWILAEESMVDGHWQD